VIHLDSPSSVRRLLAALAVGATALLVYASFVPLDYTPLSWQETWDQWWQVPWFNLSLYHRADWVANALVVLPSGIFATAAVGWGRKQVWPAVLAAPFVSVLLAGVVTGIEFAQIWFPTRTVSLNDLAAGYIGAVLGPLIWIAAGHHIERGVKAFVTMPRFEERLTWLCLGYLACITIYSVLPLDMVVTRDEWQSRLVTVRDGLNPFNGDHSSQQILKGLVLGAVRMTPLGLLLAINRQSRLVPFVILSLPVAFELIQLPFYSKHVSLVEILGGWIGGGVGYFAGVHLSRFQRLAERPVLWGLAWLISFVTVLGALLLRNDGLVTDSTDVADRFANAWSIPLAKYYVGTEYGAYTNMLAKAGLFAVLGAIAFGWQKTSSQRTSWIVFAGTLLTVIVAAFGIELLQVVLPPLIPDMSDGFTYLLGYAAGYQITRFLWGAGYSGRSTLRVRPCLGATQN
jgi:VanZ family protein